MMIEHFRIAPFSEESRESLRTERKNNTEQAEQAEQSPGGAVDFSDCAFFF
jgi:hypothetical protein